MYKYKQRGVWICMCIHHMHAVSIGLLLHTLEMPSVVPAARVVLRRDVNKKKGRKREFAAKTTQVRICGRCQAAC